MKHTNEYLPRGWKIKRFCPHCGLETVVMFYKRHGVYEPEQIVQRCEHFKEIDEYKVVFKR